MIRIKSAAIVVATIGLIAAGTALASPASAATYDGVNPDTSSCNNTATTVKSATVKDADGHKVGTLELRYSTACRTVWARVIQTGGDSCSDGGCGGLGGTVVRNSDGKKYNTTHKSGSTEWSNMLNDAGVTSYASAGYDPQDGRQTSVRTGSY